ncbi:MAG: nitrile hydratase accessory protein [Pseudonocardia sp.]|mgnify:CR=1 FL=1|uniref:nitrile hydratase accessory protein n=1 Tax=unclassified Pseudonocardia TaxID=2619320 RepID=UPI00086950AB|nr:MULTISPECIES: nitrile hydratase accessory protein [unclassified Pseudonocardia]MBN9107192.1 nitrile hydratase accessory protein [Pseudonocardia sp.]ODU26948.1 MAG: nitrile hydratase accessory protein [Pseudonocardia sp. SCN 72-51]ODV05309.1 MAG: nitrile hydratase accessory protein [Pseudonocardia sp. SCN 73-27]
MTASITVPDLEGAAAIPRSNGEPTFDAPWQSRAFGLVVSLHEQGLYPWDEFKNLLIDEIERSGVTDTCDPAVYYRQFTGAFFRLLEARGILSAAELDVRTDEEKRLLAHEDETADEHGHGHGHGH